MIHLNLGGRRKSVPSSSSMTPSDCINKSKVIINRGKLARLNYNDLFFFVGLVEVKTQGVYSLR